MICFSFEGMDSGGRGIDSDKTPMNSPPSDNSGLNTLYEGMFRTPNPEITRNNPAYKAMHPALYPQEFVYTFLCSGFSYFEELENLIHINSKDYYFCVCCIAKMV